IRRPQRPTLSPSTTLFRSDESDADERPEVEELDGGAVRVSSRMSVDDLGELFGIDLEDHDVETVGGLLAERLGRVPLPGAEAERSEEHTSELQSRSELVCR